MTLRLGTSLALAFALFATSGVVTRADAATITFDFETSTATSTAGSRPGALTSLALSSSGLTMTLTRPGSTFDIVNSTTFGAGLFPASFGTRSLDPFFAETSNTPFVANFSTAVTGFTLSYGDFGGDPDVATIQAFSGLNGTGTLLASATNTYGTQSFPIFNTFGVTAAGIQSIVFIGGSNTANFVFPNSVYYDNFVVTTPDVAVPEPSSLLSLSIAGLVIAAGRKVVRKKAVAY